MAEVWRIGNAGAGSGMIREQWGMEQADIKETGKDWREQDIGCSPKVYRNLSVESGGSSGGLGEGGKRLEWRSGDSIHN